MKNLAGRIALLIISAILGVVLVSQIKTSRNVIGDVTLQEKEKELNDQLVSLIVEKQELTEELERIKLESEKNENEFKNIEENLNKLKEELDNQKVLSGYYDVIGDGTIITIKEDEPYVTLAGIHQYILALISYLNNAGVEAISINGQRYTNYTEIVPVTDHINVNGVAMVAPIEIKAIGNSRTIEASLNFVGGIVTQLNSTGYSVDIENATDIVINKYEGQKQFKYAVPYNPIED